MPKLTAFPLSIVGSVYAGGDYGGEGVLDYNKITVTGTSHVYIDGTDYNTGTSSQNSEPTMELKGGVFGSGASCDAGSTRLVTLKNYGQAIKGDDGTVIGTTRSLTAIQRADRVLLDNAHVTLTGESDVANANQTALYSLNNIGNYTESQTIDGGNGLVLQSGSTLALDAAAIELAQFKSIDQGGNEVALDVLSAWPNTLLFDTGTVFRVSYTPLTRTESGVTAEAEIYGPVGGYTYLFAGKQADAYAYAAQQTETAASGFADKDNKPLAHTDVNASPAYRYWKVADKDAAAVRSTVLTAQTLASGEDGYGEDGYAVAKGSIELPPAEAGAHYTIETVTISDGLTLADAAKNGEWVTSAINDKGENSGSPEKSQQKIKENPLSTFGLFMKIGSGFQSTGDAAGAPGKVVSNTTAGSDGAHSIIGQATTSVTDGSIPTIEFYLTYYNAGITASRSAGTVEIVLKRSDGAKTIMKVEIVTKTSSLTNQTVDLYATQSGSYTGRLIIPSGANRQLSLSGVKGNENLVAANSSLTGHQFSLTMQPVNTNGWNSSGLRTDPYDLGSYASEAVSLGTTDSRYEAPIEFVLKNAPGFGEKDSDEVQLTLTDQSSGTAQSTATVTLCIHWEAPVVSQEVITAGRQYNGVMSSASSVIINQQSAVTAAFTLSSQPTAANLWLELKDKDKNTTALPKGTKLTLLTPSKYYDYIVTGGEAEGKISLTAFQEMWGSSSLSGSLSEGTVLTVIADFSAASIAVGDYSLHLRSNTGADSNGAAFTVNNAAASAVLTSGGEGLAKGEHVFSLTVKPQQDARLLDGSAAVLSLPDGQQFPEGVVFIAGGQHYYPSGGKVYLPLSANPLELTMDTTQTTGLQMGSLTLQAAIYANGYSAGEAGMLQAVSVSAAVKANPRYALKVEALAGQSRVIESSKGAELTFTVTASASEAPAEATGVIQVQQKTEGVYTTLAETNWSATGAMVFGSGTQKLTITVPAEQKPGTYRLLFYWGEQRVPYNIIITESTAP